jgi:hypothetical protein
MLEQDSISPPTGGKFQPGRSGNLKGRPRKSTSAAGAVRDAYNAKITVNEAGKRRRITKKEATATQLANKSALGDPRATKMGLDIIQREEDREAAKVPPPPEFLAAEDQAIVERLVARLLRIEEARV